jgi:molybdopterin-containing oxidoreductase family iron-sulfur binding subunit
MDEGKTRIVRLNIGNKSLKVPVLVQPCQADNTVGISIGYGREKSGRVSNGVGVNAYPLKVKVNGIY